MISSSILPETEGSNLHPVTRAVVKGIGFLFQNRETLNFILTCNCFQALEGIHRTKSFPGLIYNLMLHLESVLKQNSKLLDCRELQHIFMVNNLQFVLQRVENIGLMEPIEYDWVMRYRKQIEHYLEEYIKTSWAPISSHVADKDGKHFSFWKPSCVQQFTTAFQSVYDIQKHCKIPDPRLREKLRASISKKIVPSHSEYLKKHRKADRS
jgi:exocyst complex protein 7